MYFKEIIEFGAFCSIAVACFVFGALKLNPRLLLQDYPPDVKKSVPPLTRDEKVQSLYFTIPMLLFMFGVPFSFSIFLRVLHPAITYIGTALNIFLVFLIFNLVDLFIIDWLIICTITPKFVVIKGTEGFPGYKNYFMHLRGFLMGLAVGAIASLLLSWLSKFLG